MHISGNIIKHPITTMFASYNNLLLCTIHSVTPLSHKTFVLERKRKSPFQVSAGSSDALTNAPTNADLKNNFYCYNLYVARKIIISNICSFCKCFKTKITSFSTFFQQKSFYSKQKYRTPLSCTFYHHHLTYLQLVFQTLLLCSQNGIVHIRLHNTSLILFSTVD